MMGTAVITQHVFEHAGCHIHYWLAGPLHRPLVVFTHGATMDHCMFEAQVASAAQEYRVLTWDVRGHGESRPIGSNFSIRGVVRDLLALLDQLGYKQATFIGHSMGGYVSQELLFFHPDRVSGLVTIGATCITLNHPKIIALGMRLSPIILGLYPYDPFKRQAAYGITVTAGVRAYVYEVLSRLTKEEFVTIWSAVMNCLHYEPGYRILHPLIVTHGEHDNLGFGIMKRQAKAWVARDSNSRYVVIPSAGHNANQENPAFFNALLLEFLNQHVPIENDV
jgi:3-oxoadipate enol-lactonase